MQQSAAPRGFFTKSLSGPDGLDEFVCKRGEREHVSEILLSKSSKRQQKKKKMTVNCEKEVSGKQCKHSSFHYINTYHCKNNSTELKNITKVPHLIKLQPCDQTTFLESSNRLQK